MAESADELTQRPLPHELEWLLHDLRGPLNSALVHLEVIKRAAGDDPALVDSVRAVLRQITRLGEMLPAVFSVSALERRAPSPVPLRALVASVLATRGWGDVVVTPAPWPRVLGDDALLALAVEHLVRNALEATKPGAPPPRVAAVADGAWVGLRVRDWGSGVRSTNPRLLIRLMQSTKPGHAGLGLLVVERVARVHGGTVTFSAPGDGTEVALTLPRAAD